MGLDAVEFVLAVEEAFGVAIPDEDAAVLLTPRQLVDYLESRLPSGTSSAWFPQRAFFRLRAAVVRAFEVPRNQIKPQTAWDDILPDRGAFRNSWRQLQSAVGAPVWPQRSLLGYRLPSARTVGATAEYLAERTPHLFKQPAEGWSRAEIERVVRSLLASEMAIKDFKWDDTFAGDLGFS